MVGNFIADTVKGSNFGTLPDKVQKGIIIHRAIDTFTDNHQLVLESRKILYSSFGKYAAVVQDVFYDHFLAVSWDQHHLEKLQDFTQYVYGVLNDSASLMNDRALRTLHYMTLQDWLKHYASYEGIDRSLKGLSARAKFHSNMENSIPVLKEHHSDLNAHFTSFFPELKEMVLSRFASDLL